MKRKVIYKACPPSVDVSGQSYTKPSCRNGCPVFPDAKFDDACVGRKGSYPTRTLVPPHEVGSGLFRVSPVDVLATAKVEQPKEEKQYKGKFKTCKRRPES